MRKICFALALASLCTFFGCSDNPSTPPAGNTSTEPLKPLSWDMTYGEDGLAWAYRAHSSDQIFASAIASDGSILNGGSTAIGTTEGRADALLVKFDASGQIDSSYGINGFSVLPIDDDARITSIVALPNGEALIAGVARRLYDRIDAFVARVDSKGALDPSFGTEGITRRTIETSIGFSREIFIPMTRAANGDIAILVPTSATAVIWELDANGQINLGFGINGAFTLQGEQPRDVIFEPDGKLLALATTQLTSYVYRILANGSWDTAFGDFGTATLGIDAYDMDRNASGQILLAGSWGVPRLIVLDTQGKPDASFGQGGIRDVIGSGGFLRAAWLPNDEIIASMGLPSIADGFPVSDSSGLMKFANMGLELTFDWTDGIAMAQGGNVAALLSNNGAVYMSGAHVAGNMAELRQAFTFAMGPDGAGITTYGMSGLVQVGSNAAPEVMGDMVRSPDGSWIATGNQIMARYVDGQQDLAFGDNGFVATTSTISSQVAVDSSGRILVPGPDLRVTRYLKNGTLDSTFGTNGVAVFSQESGRAGVIAIDSKGRIVVGGDKDQQFALVARLLDDGQLDKTFANEGIDANTKGSVSALFVEDSGKIVVVNTDSPDWIFVSRMAENGTADLSFASGGYSTAIPFSRMTRIIRRRNGGYVMAGGKSCMISNCQITVIAVDENGQFDNDFGEQGVASIGSGNTHNVGLAELPDESIVLAGSIEDEVTKTERLAVWRISSRGATDQYFGKHGEFRLPIKSRGTVVQADDTGFIVGGWAFQSKSGTDMATLRFVY